MTRISFRLRAAVISIAALLVTILVVPAEPVRAWDSSCFNPPVTQREIYWLGVTWFEYVDSNLNSNGVTTDNFLSWRYFAASGSAGSEIQIKLDNGSFTSFPYPCGALSYTGLAEGAHTLRIEQNLGTGFGWCASWVWSNCKEQTFYVDSVPPPLFSTISPIDAEVVGSNPVFRWNSTTDATSGTKSYALHIDGIQVAVVDPNTCASTCSVAAPSRLSDGEHTFRVVATDGGGLTRSTVETAFLVRDVPVAAISVSPLQGLTGQAVALSASSSTIENGGALSFEWDLDNDGVFEKSTGTESITSVTFSSRGSKTVKVRVTSVGGLQSTATTEIPISQSPPTGEIGLSINEGANYTTTKTVGLNLVWPRYASTVRISNDGGFRPELTKSFDVNSPINWELDDSVSGLYTKVVYVRFEGAGIDLTRTYSDDIIFDNRPPAVAEAEGTTVGDYINLSILATDPESGLLTVDVGSSDKFVTLPYSATVLAKISEVGRAISSSSVRTSSISGVKIRVRDRAGNQTSWIAVSSPSPSTEKNSARTTLSRREISTPLEVAAMSKIVVGKAKRVALKVAASSRKTCMMVGSSVIGLKTGRCQIVLTVIPTKGKPLTKTLKIAVT